MIKFEKYDHFNKDFPTNNIDEKIKKELFDYLQKLSVQLKTARNLYSILDNILNNFIFSCKSKKYLENSIDKIMKPSRETMSEIEEKLNEIKDALNEYKNNNKGISETQRNAAKRRVDRLDGKVSNEKIPPLNGKFWTALGECITLNKLKQLSDAMSVDLNFINY